MIKETTEVDVLPSEMCRSHRLGRRKHQSLAHADKPRPRPIIVKFSVYNVRQRGILDTDCEYVWVKVLDYIIRRSPFARNTLRQLKAINLNLSVNYLGGPQLSMLGVNYQVAVITEGSLGNI